MKNWILLVFSLFDLLLGLFVLVSNHKKITNIIFAAFTFLISFWAFSIFLMFSILNDTVGNLAFVPASFIPSSFLIFSLFFPDNAREISLKLILSIFFPALFFSLISPSQLIIRGYKFGSDKIFIEYGILFVPFVIYFTVFSTIAFLILFFKYKKSKGLYKLQIKYVFLGTCIFALLGLFSNLIIPFLGWGNFAQYGPIFSIFMIGFTTYAIVKHRLMDIRFVVARSVAYAILLVILAAFYAGSVLIIQALFFPQSMSGFNFAEGAVRTVIAVIMVFLFQPLKGWITHATDKIFFKNQYNPEEFLDTLSHAIGSSIVLIELLYKTLNHIISEIKITRGIVVVLTDVGHILTSQSMGYKESPKIEERDILHMIKDGVLVYDELPDNSRHKVLLRKYDAAVAIPLKTEKGAEGLLLLGEKLSGDMYSASDLRVFEIIAPELAVAINNSKSYEKIEKFNVTLRQEIKKATAELERKNEQLRELDKAKDEFISMASHQLRTPLTAIKGYLSMLLEGDAGEIKVSQYDFVNEAFQGANRMVGLINDLLNVSRMETGRFFLEITEFDLDKVVQEEVKQLQNHAKEKHLYLKYEKKGKIPKIWADETKIRQVVMNFIDNAIYYTTQGGVTVTLAKEGSEVVFKVEDTGIGVPKEAQKNLFTKFYRADNARHVRPDGTGLGIYLAKKVIDDHNGKIIFRSQEGKGSLFGFRLPIKSKLKTTRVSAPMPNSNGTPAIGELAAGVGVPATSIGNHSTASAKGPQEKSPTESAKDLISEAEIARESVTK